MLFFTLLCSGNVFFSFEVGRLCDIFDRIVGVQRALNVVDRVRDDIVGAIFGVDCVLVVKDLRLRCGGGILIGDHGADALKFGRDAIDDRGCNGLDLGVLVVDGHLVARAVGEKRFDIFVGLAGDDIHLGGGGRRSRCRRSRGRFGLRGFRLWRGNITADHLVARCGGFGLRRWCGLWRCHWLGRFQRVDAVGVIIGRDFLGPARREGGRHHRRTGSGAADLRLRRGRGLGCFGGFRRRGGLRWRCGFFRGLRAQDDLTVLLARLDATRDFFLGDMGQHLRIGLCGFCTEIPILRRQVAEILCDGLHGAE